MDTTISAAIRNQLIDLHISALKFPWLLTPGYYGIEVEIKESYAVGVLLSY